LLVEHHLAGLGILDPEVLGHVAAAQDRVDPRPHVIGDPVHRGISDWLTKRWGACQATARRARRTPCARPSTSVATASAGSAVVRPSAPMTLATALTIAVPTTTPSADAPIASACAA